MDYPSDPQAKLHNGQFTQGDPGGGIPASRVWAPTTNALIEEILNVMSWGNVQPDENDTTQLRTAIINRHDVIYNNFDILSDAIDHRTTVADRGGAPTADDDETAGYWPGALWIERGSQIADANNLWICHDATASNARWYAMPIGRVGAGSWPPDASNGWDEGYRVGSIYVAGGVTGDAYVCIAPGSSGVTNAVWKKIT